MSFALGPGSSNSHAGRPVAPVLLHWHQLGDGWCSNSPTESCQDRKTGETKSSFPPFRVLIILPLPSCSFVKIHFGRSLVIKRLMWALLVIKREIAGQCLAGLARRSIIVNINFFILDS